MKVRLMCTDLTKQQLDFYVIGAIMSHTTCEDVAEPRFNKSPKNRQQTKVTYNHMGYRICKETFLELHNIG